MAEKKAMKAARPAAKKAVRKSAEETEGEDAVLAKIVAMPAPYRAMGERLHSGN